MREVPWVEKHRPRTLEDIKGQKEAVEAIRNWIKDVREGKKVKPLLLVGPPGSGKTSAAHAIANELGYDVVEVNASDLRDRNHLQYIVESSKAVSLLTGSRRLVILDEIDALPSEGYAIASLVKELIARANLPIVMTANDPYERHLYEIRSLSTMVKFSRVRWQTVVSVLREICRKERFNVPEEVLTKIAKSSQGDLRAAINDLEGFVKGSPNLLKHLGDKYGKRDIETDVFKVLSAIFYGENCYSAYLASLNLDMDPDMLFRWIEENVAHVYKGTSLTKAYEMLSLADLMRGRIIKTNNWRFLAYFTQLMTFGVCTAKERRPEGERLRPPEVIKQLSATKEVRARTKKFLEDIARRVHLSTTSVRVEIVPLLIADAKAKGKLLKSLGRELGIRESDMKEIISDLEEIYKLEVRGKGA
ncbi:MAG: replication factor C large subunit [Candidatus Korarchaeum sp.]|nr:replication factor C large subunit [Candidatus Korarchaeum sp.]MDW8035716.1 replication factor C large subunit [Candidatus Korarchaeum sp.]